MIASTISVWAAIERMSWRGQLGILKRWNYDYKIKLYGSLITISSWNGLRLEIILQVPSGSKSLPWKSLLFDWIFNPWLVCVSFIIKLSECYVSLYTKHPLSASHFCILRSEYNNKLTGGETWVGAGRKDVTECRNTLNITQCENIDLQINGIWRYGDGSETIIFANCNSFPTFTPRLARVAYFKIPLPHSGWVVQVPVYETFSPLADVVECLTNYALFRPMSNFHEPLAHPSDIQFTLPTVFKTLATSAPAVSVTQPLSTNPNNKSDKILFTGLSELLTKMANLNW